MTITSLSASTYSAPAISSLNKATRELTDSVQRLSSGIRFVNAGDDVGGMSIAARLNGQLAGLRQAQMNNLQADSMLQTAYSAASTISEMLDTMRILAVQANSGALSDVERATLDVEFQALKEQIDTLASETNFNGIALLDGTAGKTQEFISDTTNGTQSSATVQVTSTFGFGESFRINGVTYTAGANFATGASALDSATNLANALIASTHSSTSHLTITRDGTDITFTARAGGRFGNANYIDDRPAFATGAARYDVIGGVETSTASLYRFDGGVDDGLNIGSTKATGSIGDTLVATQSQVKSSRILTIVDNNQLANGDVLLRLDNGTAFGFVDFTASTADPVTNTQFKIGESAEETLDNLVQTITNYDTAANLYAIDRMEFRITDSNKLTIQGRVAGALTDQDGQNIGVNIGVVASKATLSGTSLNNGTQTGVTTDFVANPDFVGTISGFTATYNSNDNITAQITIGDYTYSARFTDTTPASATAVAFMSSDGGGMFTVQIAAGGLAVANQSAADTFATRLDTAFSTLTFYQNRRVTSFEGTGLLGGGMAFFNGTSFEDLTVNSISLTDASSNGEASIEIDVEGEIYSTGFLGRSIGPRETFTLTHESDSNRTITIVNGNSDAVDLTDPDTAISFLESLRTNFGLYADGEGSLEFQVGSSSDDIIAADIASASTDILFDEETPDIITQTNAEDAIEVIDAAIDELGELLAGIGAAQSRLSYNYDANASAIIEIDFARSSVEDTDIASESTAYAKAAVRQQASVAVLAQTQLLNSSLLDLLTAE